MEEYPIPAAARDAFFATVWKIARMIPPGKVFSYGQIAKLIPTPEGVPESDYSTYRARWVGQAMNACPGDVPWQRVINAQGKISYRGGSDRQRSLLEAEGVIFDARDRVDFKQFGWEGPDGDWLRANNLIAPEAPQQFSLF
jgi:methylated-DNA-protein-cysteine methyltransferase-like protein